MGRRGATAQPTSAARPPTPFAPAMRRVWPRLAAVALVVIVGLGAAWAVARSAQRDADRRERVLAQQTGNLTEATMQQLVAAISGVSGLADQDGVVRADAFATYATGAVAASPFETLAYAPVVRADERAAFEQAIGRPIVDAPGQGPAPPRPAYLPVQWVTPMSTTTNQLVGFDLAMDDVRRAVTEQAADEGTAVVSRVVPAQPNREPAVIVAHAVYRAGVPVVSVDQRRAAVVGFVVTGVQGEPLLAAIDAQLGAPVSMRVEDAEPVDGEHMALFESDPAPEGGVPVERSAGGRRWRITVDDRRGVPAAASWWLVVATAALAGTLGVFAWRAVRHQRQVGRHVATVDHLAGIGRSLGGATSADAVARIVRTEVPAALAAERADLAFAPGTGGPRGGPEPPSSDEGSDETSDEGPGQGPGDPSAAGHDGGVLGAPTAPGGRPGVAVRRRIPDEAGVTVATLEVAWPRDDAVDDLMLAGLATVGEMCGQALARARLIDRTRRDAVSSRLLAGLAEAAATAGTTEQVALTLVDRAAEVPGATSTHIGLLNDDGRSLTVVHQGLGPPGSHRRDVVALDHPWPMVDAFRRNATVLVSDLDDAATRYPDIVDGLASAGLAAVASVPLVGVDGAPFGAITLAWSSPMRFDARLTTALQTTADLCASSLERARATDRAQAGTSALAALASHLSTSRSFDEVGSAIVEHATRVLDADFALVGVIEGGSLRLLAPEAPRLDVLRPYRETALDGDFPALRAVRERRLVTFPTLDDIAEADLHVAEDLARMGLRAAACAPLAGSDGAPAGVFMVLWRTPPQFDDELRSRITTVADLCAQSIERSRLFDAEHRVRRDLQRTVLPEPPDVPGITVATRYEPAARSVGMGGDWYDAIALAGDRLCLVVGDVSGHGVEAVATMTQIRTVVHTLVAGGMSLPDVLVRTSETMRRDELGYATVLLAVVDQRAGSLDYVTAGHPPPVVREPGGAVRALTGGRHSLLGIDLTARPAGYVPFPVGATLVVYTDGLVERRDTAIATSIDDLVVHVRAVGDLEPDAIAESLLAHRPVVSSSEDDVALVVARRTA